MTTIIWYPDGPQADDTAETYTAVNLATWVCEFKDLPKQDLFMWRGVISDETRVIEITEVLLSETDTTFYVSEKPNGPEVWIPLIISLVIGVASALLFTPNIDVPDATNSNKSSSNALQNRGNSPRVNKRLPDIRGKEPKAYPDLWMTYKKFKDNEEFEISYLCLSVGEVAVPAGSVRDGDTLYSDIAGSSAAFYKPYESPNNGATPFLQIGDVITDDLAQVTQSNEVTGATLLPPNYDLTLGTFKVFSTGRIELVGNDTIDFRSIYKIGDGVSLTDFRSFELTTPPDIYGIHAPGSLTDYTITAVEEFAITVDIVGLDVFWSFLTGDELPTQAWQSNINTQDFMLTDPSPDPDWTLITFTPSVQPSLDKTVGLFDCSNTTEVWLNLVAQGGIYKKKTTPVLFDITVSVLFVNTDNSDTTFIDIVISSNREDAAQSTFELTVPYVNCVIGLRRTTDTDYDFDGNVVDEVKWRDLYLVNPVTAQEFGNVTTIMAKTRATDTALRVKDRKLSCQATRYMTRPDTTYIASDDMADVIYSLHTDPFIGRRTSESIDHVGLYALQASMVAYFGRSDAVKVGYTFDDDIYRYEDHLFLICSAVNVSPYQVGSVISFFFEGPQQFSTQQFGHRSKLPVESGGTERRNRLLHPPKDFDGVELTYKNGETGDFETIYVPANQSAINPDIVSYDGCTITQNAQVRADRIYQKQLYERVTHEFTALDKARLLAQGQRVDVIDNTRSQTNDGYVDGVDGLRYYLSQPSNLVGVASIVLTKRDGSVEGIPVTVDADGYSVLLDYPPSEAPYVGYLADCTEYSLAVDNLRSSLAMLVKTIEPAETDNVLVTCVNYDERYYDKDLL